jgi:thiol-disulfide isomerase/thioredoxin
MKIILFKSDTCGPCKLFQPQCEEAAKTLSATFEAVDVNSDDNIDKCRRYNVMSSGIAIVLNGDNDENLIYQFDRPCAATFIVETVENKLAGRMH